MKIGIVGAGQVGATTAYSMTMRRVGSGMRLSTATRIWGLRRRATFWTQRLFADPVLVRVSEFADLDGARLVVLAAGLTRGRGRACCCATPKSSQIVPALLGGGAEPDFPGGHKSGRHRDHGNRRAAQCCVGTDDRVGHHPRLRAVLHAARRTSRYQPDIHRCASTGRT